ncbi:MAG: LPS export ABC transporter permease LptF [Xanthomonadales bacterium]|nr:LPS export ABC transporter permease LptF [Xanthomonadales bacterium]
MQILDRHIAREAGLTWLAVTAVLLLVTLGLALGDTLADVAAGRVPGPLLFTQISLKTLEVTTILVPLSFFLGVMLAFGRMHRDSEMSVMRSCGYGIARSFLPLLYWIIPIGAALLAISLVLSPWAARTSKTLIAAAMADLSVAGLQPGRFQEIAASNSVVYIERLDPDGNFHNAFIHLTHGGRKDVVTARTGFQYQDEDGSRYLALVDGFRTEGTPGSGDYRRMRFARNDVRLPDTETTGPVLKFNALPIAEILSGDSPQHTAEWHWRLAPPLALLVLTLVAVPLSKSSPRRGYYGNLVLGITLYVVYANLLSIGRAWIEDGRIPEWIGLWWVHLLGVGLALWLLRGSRGKRRSRRSASAAPA